MSEETVVETGTEEPTIADALNEAFDRDEDKRDAEELGTPPEGEQPQQTREGRDALGRFAPKKGQDAPPEATEAAPVVTATPEATAPATEPQQPAGDGRLAHAPQSWKPEEREAWNAMPMQAREAVARREAEVTRALHESSESRRGIEAMRHVVAPYLNNINAAAGGDVVGSIKYLFDYDNRLRHGTQIEKARAVTALIKSYGVDVAALDSELAGAPHDPQVQQQDAVQQALQRELGPMRAYLAQLQQQEQQRQQYAQQSVVAQVSQSIEQFAAAPENRHFQLVRNNMADLLDLAKMQNRSLTLKDAYETACWQNPKVRGIIMQEMNAQNGATRTQAAQRARSAAVSVTGAPRTGPSPSGAAGGRDDRGADIREAWDRAAGQE